MDLLEELRARAGITNFDAAGITNAVVQVAREDADRGAHWSFIGFPSSLMRDAIAERLRELGLVVSTPTVGFGCSALVVQWGDAPIMLGAPQVTVHKDGSIKRDS